MTSPPAPHLIGKTKRPELSVPELLVSVQSIEEFERVAAIGDIDIIDLKDPSRGALTPTSAELWHEVAERSLQRNERSPQRKLHQSLSAALGEFDLADQCVEQLPPEFRFAKMGLSGCDHPDRLPRHWESIQRRLPEQTELVAVAYADWRAAQTIRPIDILHLAAHHGMQRILIDTFIKDGQSTINHLGIASLREFSEASKQAGMWWSLAGSIDLKQIDQLETCGIAPNCIGVRGAVCDGSRDKALSIQKCERLCHRMASWCLD